MFGVPQVEILVDDDSLYAGDVQEHLNFDVTLNNGAHCLKVVHFGKKITHSNIDADRHIMIKKILFNNVDLDQIDYCQLTQRGRFYPVYESSYVNTCDSNNITLPEFICPNHYLGHNGTWVLDFETPEYTWIIQEQRPSGINLEDTIFSSGNDTLLKIKSFFNV